MRKHNKDIRKSFLERADTRLLSSLILALLLHFGVLIFSFINKSYELSAAMNLQGSSSFFQELTVIDEVIEEDLEEESIGKAAGEQEGAFGKRDKVVKSKVPKTEGELVDRVRDVGVVRAISSLSSSGALSSVFGNRSSFTDQLTIAASGGVDGELIMGYGAGGMGLRGTGSGGGGSGFGRIHGIGTVDTGGGRGTRSKLKRRKSARKKFRINKGKPTVSNYCKNADILRVVSSRQRSIQYCYEKELARNPELRGKVVISWRIGLSGKVMKAWIGSSSLKNGNIESCMTRAVKFWRFSKPDGGICEIKFPFVFNQGF